MSGGIEDGVEWLDLEVVAGITPEEAMERKKSEFQAE